MATTILSCALLFGLNTQAQDIIGDYDFESGTQGWTIGSDAQYYTGGTYACSGSDAIRVEDDKSTSIVTSPTLDISTYSSISISFCFKGASKLKNDDGFDLKYYDGSSWITLKTYRVDIDFTNVGTAYPYSFSFPLDNATYTFPTNAQFRFEGEG
ncbi:MAG: hypothetical protein WBN21_12590, partial [Algibacter sp.]